MVSCGLEPEEVYANTMIIILKFIEQKMPILKALTITGFTIF